MRLTWKSTTCSLPRMNIALILSTDNSDAEASMQHAEEVAEGLTGENVSVLGPIEDNGENAWIGSSVPGVTPVAVVLTEDEAKALHNRVEGDDLVSAQDKLREALNAAEQAA